MAIAICLKPRDTDYKKTYVFLSFHLFPKCILTKHILSSVKIRRKGTMMLG